MPFVNRPSRVADAELKLAQLQAAAEVGFRVPPTVITSAVDEARAFDHREREVIYKPLSGAFLRENREARLMYATLVDLDDRRAQIALSACRYSSG